MVLAQIHIRKLQQFGLVLLVAMALSACGVGRKALITVFSGDYRGSKGDVQVSSDGIHVVKSGETVYAISRAYGTDIQSIINENNLEPPYKLRSGQRLRIPAPDYYIVKKGDTVNGISQRLNVSSNEIVRANGMSPPYTIYVGQKLLLPGKKKEVQTASTSTTWLPTRREEPASTTQSKAPPEVVKETSSGWPRPPEKPQEPRIQSAKVSIAQPVPRANSKFLMPVRGRVISGYGAKSKGLYNDGINIAAPRGTSIKAAENGVVAYTGSQQGGFGNLILVKHSDGFISAYAHAGEMLVKRGDKVIRGQVIGKVGSSGNVDRPQLHFQLRKGRQTLDPMKYIS